uniref:Uncharacterized protein n=1 Tax=Ananas comosus var. bracteatus TaxID=296719 RepID=A0A6V7NS97_ANACO|nr:unnamed protein product [Ananas comosus var. bracteatus]
MATREQQFSKLRWVPVRLWVLPVHNAENLKFVDFGANFLLSRHNESVLRLFRANATRTCPDTLQMCRQASDAVFYSCCHQGYYTFSVQAVPDCWVPSGLTVDPLIELDRDTPCILGWVAPTSATPRRALCFRLGRDGCVHSPRDGYAYSPDWIGSNLTFPTFEPSSSAAAVADQNRGKGVAS